MCLHVLFCSGGSDFGVRGYSYFLLSQETVLGYTTVLQGVPEPGARDCDPSYSCVRSLASVPWSLVRSNPEHVGPCPVLEVRSRSDQMGLQVTGWDSGLVRMGLLEEAGRHGTVRLPGPAVMYTNIVL